MRTFSPGQNCGCIGITPAVFLVARPPLQMAAYAQLDDSDAAPSAIMLNGKVEESHYVLPDGTPYSPDSNPSLDNGTSGQDHNASTIGGTPGTREPNDQSGASQNANDPNTTDDGTAGSDAESSDGSGGGNDNGVGGDGN